MNLWSPGGVAESPQGDDLYASPAGRSFCAYASSRALLHVGSLSLWDRQPSNAPPLLLSPAGLASRWGPHTKTHLGLCPKTPLPLNCGWIRTMRSIVRTAPQIRSQGACGAFYFGFSRNSIKNRPYKRHLIPLREAVALAFRAGQKGSPQGRKTLWGEEDAPQRGGLPKVKHRVSPTQAEVASDERTGL